MYESSLGVSWHICSVVCPWEGWVLMSQSAASRVFFLRLIACSGGLAEVRRANSGQWTMFPLDKLTAYMVIKL